MVAKILCFLFLLSSIIACHERPFEDYQKSSYSFRITSDVRFPLDSVTGPKPPYIQLVNHEEGTRLLTFFNPYTRSIYYYDYDTRIFLKSIAFEKEGPNGVLNPKGYHIHSKDLIYVFNMASNELFCYNENAQLLDRISLTNEASMGSADWALTYPQFFPQTITPILSSGDQLILTGSFMWAIPDSILNNFKFTAKVSLPDERVSYHHGYPAAYYGSKFNWDDPFYTTVHYDWNPEREEMVYSFPIAHELFVGSLSDSQLRKIPNTRSAQKIQSLGAPDASGVSMDDMADHIALNDIYGGVKFDPYRNLYYRLLKKGMSSLASNQSWQDKPVSMLIYDANFQLIDEVVLGTLWEFQTENMLVTKEGLLIEWIGSDRAEDEDYLIFKLLEAKVN